MADRLAATGELAEAEVLMASRLARAQETAAILAPALRRDPSEVVIDCDLCELHPGVADGLLWEEYVEQFEPRDFDANPGDPFAPGGESWNRRLRLQTAHASLTEWEHSDFGWRLKRYNDVHS